MFKTLALTFCLTLSLLVQTNANAFDRLKGGDDEAEKEADTPKNTLKSRYTKYEFQIPMRDGVKLFTAVYAPKDGSKTYPFLMTRTPYGAGVFEQGESRYGVDYFPTRLGPKEFQDSGYIFVVQDVRGRFLSEGVWQEMTPHAKASLAPGEGTESRDMYDTVEWLLKNINNNNGKVGILGTSYPGFYTSASIIDSHPAIKAASPQAPIADLFMGDDSYHGGAFMLSANFDFYASFTQEQNPTTLPKKWEKFDYGTEDAYQFFLSKLSLSNILASMNPKQRAYFEPTVAHSTYDDFWKSRNIAPHLKNIKAAVLTVGGWYDAEDLQGPLTTYQSIEKNNPGIFNGIVMGPWVHGAWSRLDGEKLGYVNFDSKTGEHFRKNILFPFFEQYLKGVVGKPIPEAQVFETGTNIWRNYDAWPPREAKARTLYFGANGSLSWTKTNQATPSSESSFDEYTSDPRKPVPYINYPALGVPQEYMVSDQRFASTRPDVLTYQTEVLEQDVTLVGSLNPSLFVSTTGTDGDWVVKLIDVYPSEFPTSSAGASKDKSNDVGLPSLSLGAYQQLVRGGPFRGKFRNSFEKPEPFTPGKIERLSFVLPDINHTFRRGHRIMVQVQSTWFPLVDLNPQTFIDIPKAKPEDFQKATQRVFRSRELNSGINVQVISN